MCCTAEKGCGVSPPNWLKDAKYEGEEVLSGESFYKWSISSTIFLIQPQKNPTSITPLKMTAGSPGESQNRA
jgi:hypothetical protein